MAQLLERENELDALGAALARARGGHGSVVLLAGEAGIGKTSLVSAFEASAGTRVCVGSCQPLDLPAPLAPLYDIAPALGRRFAASLGTDPAAIGRSLLETLRGDEPSVIVIEDIHWADAATLDVLRVAARRLDSVPAVLVLTYRNDEAAGTGARALAGELGAGPHVVRLAPKPLSVAAVAALARPAGVDAARLLETTGGNPFLVAESLTTPDRIPPTVLDAVLARTTRLSAAARGALDIAAAIGQSVDLGLLNRVSGAQPDAIDECLDCGILVARGDALGFRHELTRAAVEEAISPPRRAQLHLRIARELATSTTPDHARIAHHAELGGDRGLVFEQATAAAEDALRVGAVRDSLAQRERALGAASPERRTEALLGVGSVAYLADAPRRSLEVLQEVVATASDPLALSRAHRHLGRAFWLLDRWGEAEASTRAAVALAERSGDENEIAVATAWLSGFLALGGQSADAAAVAEQAIAVARAAENDEALASATISLGLARGLAGDREGIAIIRTGRELALERQLLHQTIRGYVNALVVATVLRAYDEADALFPRARAFLEDQVLQSPLEDVTQSYARSLIDRGRLDEARALVAGATRANMVEGILTDVLEALIRARRGEPGARAILERALAPVAGAQDGFREGLVRLALAEVAWHDGDLAAGRHEAALALELGSVRRDPWVAGEVAAWARRCGSDAPPDVPLAPPFADELAGRWREAADAWRELGCPFDAALASLPGDDAAAREAVAELTQEGATGTVRAFGRARAERGLRVPRGPRSTTDELGLTARERDVLDLLAAGMRNAEIAAALHITEKTAGHHVSACLRKLGARSRTEAASIWGARAAKLGISPDVPGAPAA